MKKNCKRTLILTNVQLPLKKNNQKLSGLFSRFSLLCDWKFQCIKSITQRDVRFIFASIPSNFIAMFGSYLIKIEKCSELQFIYLKNIKLLFCFLNCVNTGVVHVKRDRTRERLVRKFFTSSD